MKKNITLTILCLLCAAVPLVAQTAAPENMVQIPAGKFWMGRAYTIYTDSADLVPLDKLDDRPANNIHLDAFYVDKYEVTNAEYTKFLQATGGKPPWHWPQGKIPDGKEKLPFTMLTGSKRLPTASGPANVCQRKPSGRKRREADSTGITTRGETPTSRPLKGTSSRHKRPGASITTSPFRHTLRAPMPCLSDRSSPTVMVSTT